jgi:hypothetical protein
MNNKTVKKHPIPKSRGTRTNAPRARSHSSNIASLAQSKDLLKTENDALKLQLSSLDLEIKLLKEDLDALKHVKPVKSVEYYVLKLKNKSKAEEYIELEKEINGVIYSVELYLEDPDKVAYTFRVPGKPTGKERIISSIIFYRKRAVEMGYPELAEKLVYSSQKMGI